MRSSYAALAAATFLILLAAPALCPFSAAKAAPRCPLGQILRVSKGVCVPKSENLALLSRHYSKRKPAEEDDTPGPAPAGAPTTKRQKSEAASTAPAAEQQPAVRMAQRDTSGFEQAPPAEAATQPESFSPFGALYVGAFRSTLATGFSVAK